MIKLILAKFLALLIIANCTIRSYTHRQCQYNGEIGCTMHQHSTATARTRVNEFVNPFSFGQPRPT